MTKTKEEKDKYYIEDIIRICGDKGYEFNGPFEELKPMTKLKLVCSSGHVWDSTNLSNFRRGTGCPECARWHVSFVNSKDDETAIKEILESGVFDERYIFCNSRSGKNKLWYVRCNVCANDTYSKAGLCNGIFSARYDHLKNGSVPCRCVRLNLNQEQMIFRANLMLEGTKYKCISYDNTSRRYEIDCPDHGVWSVNRSSTLYSGALCQKCTQTGFDRDKPAVFYVVYVQGMRCDFIGYGISNNLKERMITHERLLRYAGFKISDIVCFNMSGREAFELERLIKSKLPLFNTGVKGFKREATYSHNKGTLLSIVKDYCTTIDSEQGYSHQL